MDGCMQRGLTLRRFHKRISLDIRTVVGGGEGAEEGRQYRLLLLKLAQVQRGERGEGEREREGERGRGQSLVLLV